MPKKIAILCNYMLIHERIGGMDYFFKLYDLELKNKGWEVDWFFTGYDTMSFYEELTIYTSAKVSIEEEFLKSTKTYEVIVTHFTELCTKFYQKIKNKHSSSYIIAVDHNPRPLNGYSFKKRVKKRIKGMLYSKYINEFIAVSGYSKKHLIQDFGKQICKKTNVILNGLDIEKYKTKENYKSNPSNFIVACHLREQKGIQYLILAVAKIKNSIKDNFKIDIYGEGPYQRRLEHLINEYGVKSVFHFKGSVGNLNDIYYNYDYLIHPSLGETYCYSVVESLLAKLPVITTSNAGNVLGLVENEKNGFLFLEKDSDQLSKILLDIYNVRTKINAMTIDEVDLPDLSLNKMVENHLKILPCI